jgi:TP901 family phage tail tape measure protein
LAFTLVATPILGAVRAFTSGIAHAIKFERELVRVAQVGKRPIESLGALRQEIGRLSTTLGVSSEELVTVSRTLAQAGLTASQTKVALEALAKASLTPTFESMTGAVEATIAIMNQFNVRASGVESALAGMNAIAGGFAVEFADLNSVIRRAGGAFKTAGGNLNELLALFTSVRSTTRESADSIATGFRTIFTRIQRASTTQFLKDLGINLRNEVTGEFIGAYKAVEQLHKSLKTLSPASPLFSKIIEELGGFRQVSKVIPLIQQFEKAERARDVAVKGSAKGLTDYTEVLKTLSNQLEQTKERFLELMRDIVQTETFRSGVKVVLRFADAFITLADSIRPIIPLLGALAAFAGARAIGGFVKGFKTPVAKPYATGGSAGGLARLSDGEMVIPRGLASDIGTGKLNKLNRGAYMVQGRPGRDRAGTFNLEDGAFVIRKEVADSLIPGYVRGGKKRKKKRQEQKAYHSYYKQAGISTPPVERHEYKASTLKGGGVRGAGALGSLVPPPQYSYKAPPVSSENLITSFEKDYREERRKQRKGRYATTQRFGGRAAARSRVAEQQRARASSGRYPHILATTPTPPADVPTVSRVGTSQTFGGGLKTTTTQPTRTIAGYNAPVPATTRSLRPPRPTRHILPVERGLPLLTPPGGKYDIDELAMKKGQSIRGSRFIKDGGLHSARVIQPPPFVDQVHTPGIATGVKPFGSAQRRGALEDTKALPSQRPEQFFKREAGGKASAGAIEQATKRYRAAIAKGATEAEAQAKATKFLTAKTKTLSQVLGARDKEGKRVLSLTKRLQATLQTAASSRSGGRRGVGGLAGAAVAGGKSRLQQIGSRIQGFGAAGAAGAFLVGQNLQPSDEDIKRFASQSDAGFKALGGSRKAGLSGGLTGVAAGATAGGLIGGPIGAVVGAAVGGINGWVTAVDDFTKKVAEQRLTFAIDDLAKAIEEGSDEVDAKFALAEKRAAESAALTAKDIRGESGLGKITRAQDLEVILGAQAKSFSEKGILRGLGDAAAFLRPEGVAFNRGGTFYDEAFAQRDRQNQRDIIQSRIDSRSGINTITSQRIQDRIAAGNVGSFNRFDGTRQFYQDRASELLLQATDAEGVVDVNAALASAGVKKRLKTQTLAEKRREALLDPAARNRLQDTRRSQAQDLIAKQILLDDKRNAETVKHIQSMAKAAKAQDALNTESKRLTEAFSAASSSVQEYRQSLGLISGAGSQIGFQASTSRAADLQNSVFAPGKFESTFRALATSYGIRGSVQNVAIESTQMQDAILPILERAQARVLDSGDITDINNLPVEVGEELRRQGFSGDSVRFVQNELARSGVGRQTSLAQIKNLSPQQLEQQAQQLTQSASFLKDAIIKRAEEETKVRQEYINNLAQASQAEIAVRQEANKRIAIGQRTDRREAGVAFSRGERFRSNTLGIDIRAFAAQQRNISGVGGARALDAGFLGTRLGDINARIAEKDAELQGASAAGATAEELTKLDSEMVALQQAAKQTKDGLINLRDSTELLSSAQQKLNDIQKEQQTNKGLFEAFTFGGEEEKFELRRQLQAADRFIATGFAGRSQAEKERTKRGLSLRGRAGEIAIEREFRRSDYFDRGLEREEDRTLEFMRGIDERASTASSEISGVMETQNAAFLGTLEGMMEKLFTNLDEYSAAVAPGRRGAVRRHDGGSVFGASGRDVIPAMLTKGEFVVNSSASRRFRPLLEMINNGSVMHAADGGAVDPYDMRGHARRREEMLRRYAAGDHDPHRPSAVASAPAAAGGEFVYDPTSSVSAFDQWKKWRASKGIRSTPIGGLPPRDEGMIRSTSTVSPAFRRAHPAATAMRDVGDDFGPRTRASEASAARAIIERERQENLTGGPAPPPRYVTQSRFNYLQTLPANERRIQMQDSAKKFLNDPAYREEVRSARGGSGPAADEGASIMSGSAGGLASAIKDSAALLDSAAGKIPSTIEVSIGDTSVTYTGTETIASDISGRVIDGVRRIIASSAFPDKSVPDSIA